MIQFFIENQEVILPDDFSFTQIDENPLITNNGEFTLDMTISLRTAQNAKAAKFINRINKIDIDTSYNALMIDDGKYKYGTIIIQSHTNTDMTFQFLAGNSELNYNAKTDNRKIWELNWGIETEIDYDRALDSITNPIWTKNFVCTPILSGDTIINDYSLTSNQSSVEINGVTNIILQPYLLYYINKLPEVLGFTLKSNVLNDDARAQKMYIINSISSLKYADALPDMTVSEFINEIECFFNVSFFVDKTTKEISIQSLKSTLFTKKIVNIKNVLDSYVRDFSKSSTLAKFGFTKIEYDLPDSLFFKYQKLSEDVLAKCEVLTFDTYELLFAYAHDHDNENQFKIFKTGDDEYIVGKNLSLNIYTRKITDTKYINLVNKLKAAGDTIENELTLKLCPAELLGKIKNIDYIGENENHYYSILQYQLPKSSVSKFEDLGQGITETIENGVQKIPRASNIEVSLFTGKIVAPVPDPKLVLYYPFSHIDKYPEFGAFSWYTPGDTFIPPEYILFQNWVNDYFIPAATTNLRINGANGIFEDYNFQQILDTTQEYSFTVDDNPDINANNLFIYNNQKYMPISLERTKSRKKGMVKGTFYRLL